MAIDYEALANEIKPLVDEHGRVVTFVRFDQTPADSNEPWRGPADPRATPDATADIEGVFVQPTDADKLGLTTVSQDLLKRSEEILIVAPGTVAPPFDLATADEIQDEGVNKRVIFVETLRPGLVVLLYFVGVAK